MFTWISRAAAACLLAGCVAAAPAARSTVILDGALTIAGPAGYCPDPAASQESADGAVMILGPCAGSGAAPALITVTVGAPGSSAVLQSGAKALSDYFTSPAGRAALARDGRASSVQVAQVTVADGALVLRLTDRAVGEHWRGLIPLKGRAVTLTVTGTDLTPEAGRRLLDQTIALLRRINQSA